ncbi:MAG: DUF6311 domain-containing protein [Vicinamibacterales bacterium]
MADRRLGRAVVVVTGAAIGAAFFAWIAGARVLAPGEIGWTMKLDWRIHFLGWHFFRSEPWHWPPGLIEGYYHAPDGTAIGFTDSIPLAAFVLKPFARWLPMPFQYLGAWMLFCFALQGAFGVLIARVWTARWPLHLLSAALFVLMPTLLMRVGHPALCAHWLLLWAIWRYVRKPPPRSWNLIEQASLGLLAGLVHPYLAVMVLAVLTALAVRDWRDERAGARPPLQAVAGLSTAVGAVLVGWWASGLFSGAPGGSLATEGLGTYSMNLLAPLTPTGWSLFLPELPLGAPGQTFEGFQYLGAGNLALVVVAAVLAWRARHTLPWAAIGPVAIVASICAVYALSPRVTLGSLVLVNYGGDWLEPLAIFRATGRFFWPAAYLLLAGAVMLTVTRLRWTAAVLTLGLAVALQVVDLHGAHAERHDTSRDPAFHAWDMPLQSAFWQETLPRYRHLVLVGPEQCGHAPLGFEAPAYLAGLHGLTINAGEVARPSEPARRAYCESLIARVEAGSLDAASLYIVDSFYRPLFDRADVRCEDVDGVTVCAANDGGR